MSALPLSNAYEQPATRKRVVGLIRVSTAQQAGDDRGGIPRQREIIHRTIESKNLDCLRVYELVDVSGTKVRQHPDIQEILQMIATGVISGLVVADLDRLFRPDQPADFAIMQVFKDTGAVIYSGDIIYDLSSKDGMLHGSIRAAFAGFELMQIKERMQGGKEVKRRQGKCPSGPNTLPFAVTYDRKIEKFSYTAEIGLIQEAFRLVDQEGLRSYAEIGRRTGLNPTRLPKLLHNRLYIGERVIDQKSAPTVSRSGHTYRHLVKRADHEIIRNKVIDTPAVSVEQFERVQQILEQMRVHHFKVRDAEKTCNLLTGVGRCGYCGESLYCSSSRTGATKRRYYFCYANRAEMRRKAGGEAGCKLPNVRQEVLDALLEAFVSRMLTDPVLLIAIIERAFQISAQTILRFPTPDPDLRSLNQREKRLLDAFEQGLINIDEFRERRETIHAQRAVLTRAAATPEANPQQLEREKLIAAVVRGAFAFKRLQNPWEKKAIILELFSEIIIKDDSITAFRFVQPLPGLAEGDRPVVQLQEPFRLTSGNGDNNTVPLPEDLKACSTCGIPYPPSNFYKGRNQCCNCISKRASAAYQRRLEQANSQSKEFTPIVFPAEP